jgi:hypothetical protein
MRDVKVIIDAGEPYGVLGAVNAPLGPLAQRNNAVVFVVTQVPDNVLDHAVLLALDATSAGMVYQQSINHHHWRNRAPFTVRYGELVDLHLKKGVP